RLGNRVIQLFLLPGLSDTQCGFKLYRREVLPLFEKLQNLRWSFDFEVLFLARQHNFRILELPVNWTNNHDSAVQPLDYFSTLLQALVIRYSYLRNKWLKKH
ncbi:MAG: glycosyl transferase, partial [Candidatus Komeilibacteria bacterium CG_4_9_14_3_um_filter_37_5]